MQVILMDDVFNLGRRGEVVRVADGYGRNYLIPRRLAIAATPGNLKMVEQQRLAFAKKEIRYREEAQVLAREIEQLHLLISRKAGETGTLFGSVTAKDVADLLEGNGIQLDRRKIILAQPIKTIGNYKLEIRPHSEVQAELLLSVLAETDQPVAQLKKKDEESERIVAALEAKLKEIEHLTAPAPARPESEEAPRKPKRRKPAQPPQEGEEKKTQRKES